MISAVGSIQQLGATLEHADIEVLVRVADGEHDRGVLAHVPDLAGVGLREDEHGLAVPPEPDRHDMRRPVRTDRGQPDDRLLFEEAAHPGGGEGPCLLHAGSIGAPTVAPPQTVVASGMDV